jgi:hypothetical protein
MLQYVFFHQQPFDEFIEFLTGRGLNAETGIDDGSFEASLSEDIDDGLAEEIDDEYDRLFEVNRQLMETEENSDKDYTMAAVNVQLADGSFTQAFVEPELMNRIMQVLSPQEFGRVVGSIATAVENPDARSFCERVREGETA